ncbi:MAG TPA: hypothetical protein VE866_17235 [Candidatus Binatia bacterium]|nr:hypothetical protein [Candidatus Binatia bacterium]
MSESTGLRERERKLAVYWTLATHALPTLDTFPLLVLRGKMGTGKSQALKVIENFAYRSRRLSLRGMTAPAIRDGFADCYEGTAVVEEADAAWKDRDSTFEHLLSDRYQRNSAEASHKQKKGSEDWSTVTKRYFGATALHRRIPFLDAALDGRSVSVYFRPDHSRSYRDFNAEDPRNAAGKVLLQHLTVKLPPVEQPNGIAARVFNSYRPVLAAAKLCGDCEFESELLRRLQDETLELKEAQSAEPDGLVLRAVVERVFESGCDFSNIKFSELSVLIWDNHRVSLSPRQIGSMVRELGFITKPSHGVTVVVPTPATLLKACDECEYSDEGVEKLRNDLMGVDPGVKKEQDN